MSQGNPTDTTGPSMLWVRITPQGSAPVDTRRCEVPGCDRVFTHQVAFDSPDERNRVNVGSLVQAKWRTFPERRCVLVCSDHEDNVGFSDDGVFANV